MSNQSRPTVSPSAIAQFYNLQQCSMYLHHRYVNEDFAGISDISLSPLLAATGEAFEDGQLRQLLDADVHSVGPEDSTISFAETWTGETEADLERLEQLVTELADGTRERPVVFSQPRVRGTVGEWPVHGDADVVIAKPSDGASTPRTVDILIAEIKSSSAAKVHHQLQAAVYSLLFDVVLDDVPTNISASVVSQDPDRTSLPDLVTPTDDIDLRRLGTFDLDTRRNDIQLLLEAGGSLDEVLLDDGEIRDPNDPPTYRIDARCDGCDKQAKCLAHSVTNQKLSILGLAEGVQESLRELGVTDLHDLATLYEWPEDSRERRATAYSTPKPRDPELVTKILRQTEISNLLDLAQIAHRFLREIDPSYNEEWDDRTNDAGPWSDYLIGSGRNLPDDNPPASFTPDYPRKSLVRVYPYVQYDFVRDRVVLLAAKVTCTRYEEDHGDGIFISSEPEQLPNDREGKDREERRLIDDFFDKLSTAIETVRPDLSEEGYDLTDGFLHVYPYGNEQRQSLVDAVKRHPDSEAAQALRVLLGFRGDIDQEAVSVLQDDFRQRHAFRYPGLGVVQTAAQFYSRDSNLDWESSRPPGETPLKQVFDLGFFETTVPYDEAGNRIMLDFSNGLQVPSDRLGQSYPVVGRHQDVLPLEYLYASEEFDLLRTELADDTETQSRIVQYRHHAGEDSPRVDLEDIVDGAHAVCNAYEHVERSIRDKDAGMSKESLNLADLRENSLGVSALQSTCLEYQDLEFGASRRDLVARYRTPLSERVSSGHALPFEVATPPIESDDEDEERTWLEGSLLRSLGGGTDDGTQADTPLALEAGSFVVMTPLTRDDDGTLREDVNTPREITNQVLGLLTDVDTESGTLHVSLNWQVNQAQQPFRPNHVGWTTMEDDAYNRQYIEEGQKYVLDTALDDFVAHRANHALQNATENDVHNRLVNVYEDEIEDALVRDTPQFDPEDTRSLVDQFDRVMPESTNRDQRSFATQIDHTVAALQGPPGTGKTAYASTPAILSRAYADESNAFAGVATAHSNTAVDEIAGAVADGQERLAKGGTLEDAVLVRIRSDEPTGDLPDNVREYHYYDDQEELEALFEQYVLASTSPGPLIVFTTPVTLRNFVNSVRWSIDEDADSAEEFMADGRSRLFDFLLIDEASMMDLPLLFLAGAFLKQDKQLLLVGDHRQMQPIQAHDWEAEDRQTIEENTPAVSALDFVRFLRGDDDSNFERFDREPPTWHDKDSVLPMDRLKTTYRLPPAMARFETELFYHQDNIQLESGAPGHQIPDVRGDDLPAWLNAALEPESRVTVLLHDDSVYTKDSPVEAHLTERVLEPLSLVREEPADDELTGGVVVPFRLMRRRLRDQIDLGVDTVERFQGGERDVMALAMTASNQGYVNQLSEFLLDANRFNVGASRMKRKLFIVVSKSLFRAVSNDPQKYEQQKAWKQLYQTLIAGEQPAATTELTADEVPELNDRTVDVQVYTGYFD